MSRNLSTIKKELIKIFNTNFELKITLVGLEYEPKNEKSLFRVIDIEYSLKELNMALCGLINAINKFERLEKEIKDAI